MLIIRLFLPLLISEYITSPIYTYQFYQYLIRTNSHKNYLISNKIMQNKQLISAKSKTIGDYQIGRVIGKGTFAVVREAVHIPTGETVSVKILSKDMIIDSRDKLNLSRQIRILRKVRHPNIAQTLQIIETNTKIYIFMEHVSGGELFNLITNSPKARLDELVATKIFLQLLNAVEYLHSIHITHRDIKPENILLDQAHNVKLVDFGLSNIYQSGEKLSTACGSPCYAAPEMLDEKPYNPKLADLWSCGVVLYAMLCGFLPFEDNNTKVLYNKIKSVEYDEPVHLSEAAKDLLKMMLMIEPQLRPSVNLIRKHKFSNKIKYEFIRGLYPGQVLKTQKIIIDHMNDIGFIAPKKDVQRHNNCKNTAMYYLLLYKKLKIQKQSLFSYFWKLETEDRPKKSGSMVLKKSLVLENHETIQTRKINKFIQPEQQYEGQTKHNGFMKDSLADLVDKLNQKNKEKIRKVVTTIRVRRLYS